MQSNRQIRHLADSTLLNAVLSALKQQRRSGGYQVTSSLPQEAVDPTQQISVSGRLFFENCRSLYERQGPQSVFFSLHDALVDQWSPIGVVFGSADTPMIASKRLRAYEQLATRSCTSEISVVGDQAVTIRRIHVIPELAQTQCLTFAYWGMVTSAFRASGCRGIRLEASGTTVFGNRNFNALAAKTLFSGEPITLSWTDVQKPLPLTCPHFRTTCHKELIASVVHLVYRAILDGQPVYLAQTAKKLGMSSRTLQRRLAESEISLRALQRSLQLFVATGLLKDPRYNVADIAATARFADASHLIRKFRSATGMTPRSFADRLLI